MTDNAVQWKDLSMTQKEQFIAMLLRMGISIESEGEAKAYYGNKEKVQADAKNGLN